MSLSCAGSLVFGAALRAGEALGRVKDKVTETARELKDEVTGPPKP